MKYSTLRGKTVLVTGANGLIGSAVVNELCQIDDVKVVAMYRRLSEPTRPINKDAEIRQGDILDTGSLRSVFRGCDYVVHCAAKVGPGHRRSDVENSICEGTQNVVDVAYQAGAQRLVYMSSVAVYGSRPGHYTEDSPLDVGSRDPYVASKIRAERICLSSRLICNIVRPAYVLGSNPDFLHFLKNQIQGGKYLLLNEGEAKIPLVDVRDVFDVTLRCLTNRWIENQVFNVSHAHPVSWNRIFNEMMSCLNIAAKPIVAPTSIMKVVGRCMDIFPNPPFNSFQVGLLANSITYDMYRTQRFLGVTPNNDAIALLRRSIKTLS